MYVKDKVIVITGACGLLGKEFVKSILINGAIPIITDISSESLSKFGDELKSEFPSNSCSLMVLDINSKDSITTVLHNVQQKYGKIDALVNNAYPRNNNYGRSFEDVEYNDLCENVNLNLGGYFLTSQQFAGFFSKQGFGNIINISSIYGVIPPRFEIYNGTSMTMPVEYAIIKSALIHLTKYMAKLFKGKNIRFNCLSPGGIFDKQPDSFLDKYKNFCSSKGMLMPDDLTGALIFLLSDMSLFVNGQNIVVDDGFTL